jgi:hypothetical protein
LRLWFLGLEDYKELDRLLTSNEQVYVPQMTEVLREMYRVLRQDKPAVFVLGDYRRNSNHLDSAETVAEIAEQNLAGRLVVEAIVDDVIPDERRSRRRTRTTLKERVLVLRKIH